MVGEKTGIEDIKWMDEALALAEGALERGEFPVGCVLVADGRMVGRGARTHTTGGEVNELDHAEILALRDYLGSADGFTGVDADQGLTAYCTLEPCLMCLGALILNGVKRIVYGYEDVMGGAAGLDLTRNLSRSLAGVQGLEKCQGKQIYASSEIVIHGGVKRKECLELFKEYFLDPAHSYWKGSFLYNYTIQTV